jgi:hypothetical protein
LPFVSLNEYDKFSIKATSINHYYYYSHEELLISRGRHDDSLELLGNMLKSSFEIETKDSHRKARKTVSSYIPLPH